VVLFNQPRKERARETGVSARTISRAVARFVQQGLPGLAASTPPREDDGRRLPATISEHFLHLKAEHPPLSAHELATICEVAFDRRVDYRTVARVLARQPLPGGVLRRYPRYPEIPEPEERRLAIIRLHAEGWRPSRIAEYLDTSRQTVHATLRRWVEEGVRGLADKSHARKPGTRKATLPAVTAIRALQENPALGRQRVHAALKRLGIDLSPRTCGRIMAKNRALYGLVPERPAPKLPKPMPFAASRPHQYWSVDIRYIERHHVPEYADQPIYIITILDNYSRGAPRTRRLTLTEAGKGRR
jgi:transposase